MTADEQPSLFATMRGANPAPRDLSPNPDDLAEHSLAGRIHAGTGAFLWQFKAAADVLRLSDRGYARLCNELGVIAAPRLWRYHIVRDSRFAIDWRLESADGARSISAPDLP